MTAHLRSRPELDFQRWWKEEQARAEERSRKLATPKRRSIELPDNTIDEVDRVAAVQGLTRHELIEMALDFYFASWRKRPRSS